MNLAKRSRYFFAAFVILILVGLISVPGQAKDRIIEYPVFYVGYKDAVETNLNPSGLKEVLELVDVRVGGRSIIIGQPFSAEDDWLKSLVFRMRNISKQPIMGARMSFGLSETKTENSALGFTFEYGKGLSTGIPSDEQKIIKPNEEFELKFNKAQYQRHKKLTSQRSKLLSFSKIMLGITQVKFEDGLLWGANCLRSSNPGNSCQ